MTFKHDMNTRVYSVHPGEFGVDEKGNALYGIVIARHQFGEGHGFEVSQLLQYTVEVGVEGQPGHNRYMRVEGELYNEIEHAAYLDDVAARQKAEQDAYEASQRSVEENPSI